MIGLSTIRSKMKTSGRLGLSVVVTAWMITTMQPCLMAMELSPSDSVSISAITDHDSHKDHSTNNVDHEEPACPHCPPSTSHDNSSCAVAAIADCAVLPKAKPGEGILKADLSDAFDAVHSNNHYYSLIRAPTDLVVVPLDCTKPKFVVGPTISIRNCVFLK